MSQMPEAAPAHSLMRDTNKPIDEVNLAHARKLDAALGPKMLNGGAPYQRRRLLLGYDAQATELATLRGQLAEKEAESAERAKVADFYQTGMHTEAKERRRLSALLREAQAAPAQVWYWIECRSGDAPKTEAGWALCTSTRKQEEAPALLAQWQASRPEVKEWRIVEETRRRTRKVVEPAPACPSTCTGCEKAEACEPAAPLIDHPKLAAHAAAHTVPAPHPKRTVLHNPSIPPETMEKARVAVAKVMADRPAAAGSLPSGGETAENGLCFYCKGGIAPGCTCAPTTIEKKGGSDE